MVSILCIYDEGSMVDTPLIGAKGFSMLVESEGERVLFDTGLRDRYLEHNMEHLEIDPDSIDVLVVSQAHPDNCRAINGLLNNRTKPLDVYAPEGLYAGKRGFMSSSIGLSDDNRPKANLMTVDGWTEVAPKVWVSPRIDYESGASEHFLAVEGKNLAIVSGRGIAGPEPFITAAKERFGRSPRTFVGGVLLEKVKNKTIAENYANFFQESGCSNLYLNHCVGQDGISKLRVCLGLKAVNDFYVGMSLDL